MAISKLIPGFRFHPTGVELVVYFLKRKVMGKKFYDDVIAELDIYKYAPWDLPAMSCLRTGELEWYFFCPMEKKYASGSRMRRGTEIGYWKATGRDRAIKHKDQTVGMIRTLIFHTGKSPHGGRTDWVMHEHRLEDKDLADKGIAQDSYVICKVFRKEGRGPRNGAEYGRPFNEDDWDDENLGIPCPPSFAPVPILPMISDGSVSNDYHLSASAFIGSASTSNLSGSMLSPCTANRSDPNDQAVNNDDGKLFEMVNDPGRESVAEGTPSDDFFEGVEEYFPAALGGVYSGQNTEFSSTGIATTGDVGSTDNSNFIELIDLDTPLSFDDLDFMELIDLDTPLFWPPKQP